MKIANIVSHNSIPVSDDFNVVRTLDEIIQGLPTLIVGWELVKKYRPDFNVLNKKIEENLYWTFMRSEKRDAYEEDLIYFKHAVYEELIKNFDYIYVDVIQYKPRVLRKIVKKIHNLKKIISYHHDNMIYVYGENLIFGVDLELLDFVGLDKDKIIKKVQILSDVFLTKDSIFIEYKQSIQNLDFQVKYIPFLYSIKNE